MNEEWSVERPMAEMSLRRQEELAESRAEKTVRAYG